MTAFAADGGEEIGFVVRVVPFLSGRDAVDDHRGSAGR